MSPTLLFLLPVIIVAGTGLLLLATGGLIRRPSLLAQLGGGGLLLGGIALAGLTIRPLELETALFGGPAAGLTHYWIGWLAVVGLLIYEHSLVTPTDLSRLDVAFFNVNGYIAVLVLASVVGGLWR